MFSMFEMKWTTTEVFAEKKYFKNGETKNRKKMYSIQNPTQRKKRKNEWNNTDDWDRCKKKMKQKSIQFTNTQTDEK